MLNEPDNLQRIERALAELRRIMMVKRERLWSGLQLTRTQCEVLICLLGESDQSIGTLTDQIGLTQASITQTVETLHKRGLIFRNNISNDRRVTQLSLSENGNEIAGRLLHARREHMAQITSSLTQAEVESLISVVKKISHVIETPAPERIKNQIDKTRPSK